MKDWIHQTSSVCFHLLVANSSKEASTAWFVGCHDGVGGGDGGGVHLLGQNNFGMDFPMILGMDYHVAVGGNDGDGVHLLGQNDFGMNFPMILGMDYQLILDSSILKLGMDWNILTLGMA